MKKLCMLFAAIMTVVTIILCSCGTDPMESVSERRSGFYSADGDGYALTAVSGVREHTFKADGKVGSDGKLKPYTLITLVPTTFDIDAVITFTAEVDGCTFGGTMIVHPFAASFSAEFEHETTAKEFTVTIKCGGKTTALSVQSQITGDMITYDRAISAAKTAIHPKGEYETRARIIKNPLGADGLCWHVSFLTSDGGSTGVLLDPVSAKVIAKK
ncbi:MAG: hypothetical protein K2J01_03525 [Clostridiales bacterium]|nr:hypothetical protein [Clostridiales bacterium]